MPAVDPMSQPKMSPSVVCDQLMPIAISATKLANELIRMPGLTGLAEPWRQR